MNPSQNKGQTTESESTSTTTSVDYLNLEKDGENRLNELINTNSLTENSLMNIINDGNNEFKRANGRNLSYSELRSLYG